MFSWGRNYTAKGALACQAEALGRRLERVPPTFAHVKLTQSRLIGKKRIALFPREGTSGNNG